ncbi:cytosolic protein [Aquibacillus kalidii]|uniref:cytosolic protein n=1 Tax=Aquibacillus kalidii TaxID=2762597 RepID=UPI001646B39B|nr:cytosolic protein [Aquibacillus kalidii]
MAVGDFFNKYFNNHSETKDKHWDSKLQTHYFKTTKDKAFEVVEGYFRKSQSCQIIAVSKEHGEISVNYKGGGKKAFVIVTIIMVKPFRTAIDLSITTESSIPFDLGYSHKLISKIYEDFKKELEYIGTP